MSRLCHVSLTVALLVILSVFTADAKASIENSEIEIPTAADIHQHKEGTIKTGDSK